MSIATDYRARETFGKAGKLKRSEDHTPEIDHLLESMLINIKPDGSFPDGFKGSFRGKELPVEECIETVTPFLASIRLEAIEIFDQYFQKNPSYGSLVNDYQSGVGEAKRVMHLMGIFPVEAFTIRSEIQFPELLARNATANDHERTVMGLLKAVIGDQAVFLTKGPNLPPIAADTLAVHLKSSLEAYDQMARNAIANPPAPASSAPSGTALN